MLVRGECVRRARAQRLRVFMVSGGCFYQRTKAVLRPTTSPRFAYDQMLPATGRKMGVQDRRRVPWRGTQAGGVRYKPASSTGTSGVSPQRASF